MFIDVTTYAFISFIVAQGPQLESAQWVHSLGAEQPHSAAISVRSELVLLYNIQ